MEQVKEGAQRTDVVLFHLLFCFLDVPVSLQWGRGQAKICTMPILTSFSQNLIVHIAKITPGDMITIKVPET